MPSSGCIRGRHPRYPPTKAAPGWCPTPGRDRRPDRLCGCHRQCRWACSQLDTAGLPQTIPPATTDEKTELDPFQFADLFEFAQLTFRFLLAGSVTLLDLANQLISLAFDWRFSSRRKARPGPRDGHVRQRVAVRRT